MNENEVKEIKTEQEATLTDTQEKPLADEAQNKEPVSETETEASAADGEIASDTTDTPDKSEENIWGSVELGKILVDGEQEAPRERAARHRKKKASKRGFPYFYAIYAVCVLLFTAAIFCVCNYINTLLSEYEAVQPKYEAEKVFAEHFREPDISELMSFADEDFAEFESREIVISHLKEQLATGEITYAETQKKENGERIYSVYAGGKRFAQFSLVEGTKATEHGFKYYSLGDMKMEFVLSDTEYKFVVPERYTVYVNGIAVSDKYKTGNSTPTDAYTLSDGKSGVNYIEYTVSGFLTTPTFAVKDEVGAEAYHYWDEPNGLYTVDVQSVTVRVPESYTLFLEGCMVDQGLIAEGERLSSAYNKFLLKDENGNANGLDYVEYKIGGFYSDTKPVFTAKSSDGYESSVFYLEDEASYECAPANNTVLQGKYAEDIKEFFRKYTLYLMYVNITADGEATDYISKGELRGYFDTDSSAWKAFNSIAVKWQFEPRGYEFVDETIDEFISYPDGTFSCRVRHTYNSWRGAGRYSQSIDKTVFYRISGSKILIYEMTNTEAVGGIGQPRDNG